MAEKWFLAGKGKGFGPFSASQLQQMVESGIIDHDDLVWRDGDSESAPASTLGNEPPPLLLVASRPSPPPLPVSSTSASSPHPSRFGLRLTTAAILLAMIGGGGWLVYEQGWLPVKMETIPTDASVASNSARTVDGDGETGSSTSTPQAVPIREQPVETPMLPANTTMPVKVFSLTFDDDVALPEQLNAKGIALVNGISGKAAEFTGKHSIQVPCSLPEGNAPRTLSAWIRNNGLSETRNSHAIAYGKNESGKRAFGIYHANRRWGLYGWGSQQSTEAAVDDEWHHHCLTYDGATIVYWIDGRVVANISHSLDTISGPLSLGSDANGSPYFSFTGLIDDVSVYDVALTQQQIALLTNRRPD